MEQIIFIFDCVLVDLYLKLHYLSGISPFLRDERTREIWELTTQRVIDTIQMLDDAKIKLQQFEGGDEEDVRNLSR